MRAYLKLLVLAIVCSLFSVVTSTLLDKIRDDPELSQFYDLIEKNKIAMSNLELRPLTLFAPTNEAFQRYKGNQTHVQYHMTNTAIRLENLSDTLPSDFDGNPPLFITRVKDHLYVNNANIIRSRSNVEIKNGEGKRQVLHVIDDVLTPLTTTSTASKEVFNPDAFQFMTHSDSLDIGPHRVRSYRQRVITNKKDSVYQADGFHTFFIPVEEGFKPHPRPELIDRKVIDGHIISHKAVFTSSAPIEDPLPTLAFEDNIKVTISFFTQGEGHFKKTYVKSNTVVSDGKHTTGVVMAEIVRANIPVKNGVVHLIHRPLMIVDNTVVQFLQNVINEKEDGPLYKFYENIMDFGGEFMDVINKMSDITLFAPNNDAWNDPNLLNVKGDKAKMQDILNLHILQGRVNTEKIRANNINNIFQYPTKSFRKNLYFNIIANGGNQTVTVEGGGVNATLIQPDIVQVNGFVHIIDRVLGVPYSTVYDKLRLDPMLNSTYIMGTMTNFNEQLNDTTKRFTYFVPRDLAWKNTAVEFPSTHKKLFMPEFTYHTRNILERHLVISDKAFTMAALKNMNNETIALPTLRDTLTLRVKETEKQYDEYGNRKILRHDREDQATEEETHGERERIIPVIFDAHSQGYQIQWNHRIINVLRPDVECTNGIIHVIDQPFLIDSDVQVTGGISHLKSTATILFASLLMAFIAKLFV